MQLETLNTWIDSQKPRIEVTLKRLVEINTYTANTSGVDAGMQTLAEITQELGLSLETINDRHRLVKAGDGQSKPRILLISHMDTVFPPDGNFQHYDMLPDGYVRGPGVGDIKGGMVMGLWAMLALGELFDSFDVQMVVSADEEIGSPTIRDWYRGGHIGADYAIGLEPGFPQGDLSPTVPLGVVRQRRGYGAIRFNVQGKASHSGTPWLGVDAVDAATQRVSKILALNDWENGNSVTVGMINGGISPNTVAGDVAATASFRYERMSDGEHIKAQIEAIINDRYVHNAEIDQWDAADLTVEAFIPPMEHTPENQKMVDIVLAEAARLGQNVVSIARGGGSDANFISSSGTPSICGMGAPTHGIHTIEEMIYLPGLLDRINLLTSTIYRLIDGA